MTARARYEMRSQRAGDRVVDQAAGRAADHLKAMQVVTAPPPGVIDDIRLLYRRAKAAEQSRIRIDLGLYAYARVFFSGWSASADPKARAKSAAQARRVVDALRVGKPPDDADAALYAAMAGMVHAAEPSRQAFETARKTHRRDAEKLATQLPAWQRLQHIRGFGIWGLVAIIGEVGDIGDYSGCRKLFKRLGLAPDECYPTGEKKTGRKIPRNTRGRIMGIIADPLLRAQWRGAREAEDESGRQKGTESQCSFDPALIPAHAIGPFGHVYGETKARHLAAGRTKGHAEKSARRAMVKALLHDVHRGWHGVRLDYAPLPEAVEDAA